MLILLFIIFSLFVVPKCFTAVVYDNAAAAARPSHHWSVLMLSSANFCSYTPQCFYLFIPPEENNTAVFCILMFCFGGLIFSRIDRKCFVVVVVSYILRMRAPGDTFLHIILCFSSWNHRFVGRSFKLNPWRKNTDTALKKVYRFKSPVSNLECAKSRCEQEDHFYQFSAFYCRKCLYYYYKKERLTWMAEKNQLTVYVLSGHDQWRDNFRKIYSKKLYL